MKNYGNFGQRRIWLGWEEEGRLPGGGDGGTLKRTIPCGEQGVQRL
jgi:hypothetical protein